MSELNVTINGKELPAEFAGLISAVFAGKKITRTGTVNPIPLDAREEALTALVNNDALKNVTTSHPDLEVKVTTPEFVYTCKSGDMMEAGSLYLAMVRASMQRAELRSQVEKVVTITDLRPETPRKVNTASVDVDALAGLLAELA